MTVQQLTDTLSLTPLHLPEPEREIEGGYCGDLLSWVMGRAGSGNAWVTIMTNINVIAVASLADVACVIVAENSAPDDAMLEKAKAQDINLLTTSMPSFEVCGKIASLI